MNHPHTPQQPLSEKQARGEVWEVIRFVLIALAIILPLRFFVIQPFIVKGQSMEPTFLDHEYLMIDQISYRLGEPNRGDVIVFRAPGDEGRFFIKRIIGLPTETVTVANNTVTVSNAKNPDGFVLDEQYLVEDTTGDTSLALGTDEFFVMGDNRDNSFDSRSWDALPADNIVGRAWLRILPFKQATVLPETLTLLNNHYS